jgi:queuine tRNA-ribosyltransferase
MAGEMLGPILLSVHNLTFYQRLLSDARQAIAEARYEDFYQERIQRWRSPEQTSSTVPSAQREQH